MAASVAWASKRGRTTMWLPPSQAEHDHTTGPLWYSGAGMTRQPSGGPIRRGTSASKDAGSPDTISLGRPVDPPDVGAFHAGDVTSGSGSSGRLRSGW